MTAQGFSQPLGKRYLLREPLGAGGMGTVYRAIDRLTGDTVALKRVFLPPDQLAFASRSGHTDASLALAQEFRTLASLHHPHVIRVLDYGFDQARQPFYTMDLLEDARSIVVAGQDQSQDTKVSLLVQALQALAYLHRRGILHRDLKPGNVLVPSADRRVRVLDFGVSVTTSRTMEYLTQTTAGTLTYMAPELFQGAPVTVASDLYAVGVMAYELFAGRHPFDTSNVAVLLYDILSKPADLRSIGLGTDLAQVLERLLAKRREDRYGDAGQVIRDLCAATGCPLPPETVEIRESYLQAARFVGREAELAQLSGALDDALSGRGSAWLVGGESGVGKSRLLDELRTLALVRGAQVTRGQAAREGGSPYHLWRGTLRWTALTADLAPEEASVLKSLVPDIADLVGHEVADAPSLDPQAAKERFTQVASEVFGRQDRPLVVLLEDLHWVGSESLVLLEGLSRGVVGRPLLLIGSYRDDERPDLPDSLPQPGQVLKLRRLSKESIAELSASMLGPAGSREPVVDLLQRETGGNPFFLVETVRALAEETGQLDLVGVMTLPASVFAQGVRRLIQRRLHRVPEGARPLLQLAAVAGKDLDLDLLHALCPQVDLDGWLAACADVAVLEVEGGQWRFSHDRLREGTVDALSEVERPGLHRRVAEAIERVYPHAPEQVARLAYHWEQAGDGGKAATYLSHAGDQARLVYAHEEAIDLYGRALPLLEAQGEHERAARTLMKLGLTYHAAFDFRRAREAYQRGFAAWQRTGGTRPPTAHPPAPHALRVCLDAPSTLDPAMCSDVDSGQVIEQLFLGLVDWSPEMEVLPQVARSWEVSEGGRTYVFHLRDDARWTDGMPLAAADFEYAWKRVLDPTAALRLAELLYDVKGARAYHHGQMSDRDRVGVRALDPGTLLVELEAPAAYFLYLLANPAAYAVPRHAIEAFGPAWIEMDAIVTSGPFVLEAWERGVSLTLRRSGVPNAPGRGNVQRVEMSLRTDRPGRLAMYEAGDLDVLHLDGFATAEIDFRPRAGLSLRACPATLPASLCPMIPSGRGISWPGPVTREVAACPLCRP
ncbi:MAG: AAA family ATPase [Anaerolineae bacterium]|nr:AAA family ATPase [Anaerolineae bacterium]